MKKSKTIYHNVMPVEHYIFERERFTFSMALSKEQFESMKGWELNKYEADFGRQMVYRLTMLMAHGDRTVTATEDVPITWWDHLKLDVNLWALNYIRKPHLFFTNIARAIVHLSITPKFRRIESSILVKRFCPHVGVSDDRSHIEFLMHKPLNYSNFRNGGIDY